LSTTNRRVRVRFGRPASRYAAVVAAVAAAALAVAACGSSSSSSSSGSGSSSSSAKSVNLSTVSSAQAGGGMNALIAAAKKEGTLNVITLPPTWANYGTIISDFSKTYGIKINSENPNGSSADEIEAVQQLGTQSRAPDVLDIGLSYALEYPTLFAPYKVATWSSIPAVNKDPNGNWFADYGGYVSIGCDTKIVKVCPTSFKDLLNPAYKNMVALDGNPTEANAAFSAVYAAALANGGSFSNIKPGLAFFKKLKAAGNFNPTAVTPATIQSGQTPITLDWDYLNVSAAAVVKHLFKFTVAIPTDANYASYYVQSINKNAPDPAAARLWEEFLYSTAGQNLWLEGAARPIELPTLVKDGTVNKAAYSALPATTGTVSYPTEAQVTAAKAIVASDWAATVS
jgi:putative spermidine/putrescine transport system substrate-binding protein